eukprot:g5887.t1
MLCGASVCTCVYGIAATGKRATEECASGDGYKCEYCADGFTLDPANDVCHPTPKCGDSATQSDNRELCADGEAFSPSSECLGTACTKADCCVAAGTCGSALATGQISECSRHPVFLNATNSCADDATCFDRPDTDYRCCAQYCGQQAGFVCDPTTELLHYALPCSAGTNGNCNAERCCAVVSGSGLTDTRSGVRRFVMRMMFNAPVDDTVTTKTELAAVPKFGNFFTAGQHLLADLHGGPVITATLQSGYGATAVVRAAALDIGFQRDLDPLTGEDSNGAGSFPAPEFTAAVPVLEDYTPYDVAGSATCSSELWVDATTNHACGVAVNQAAGTQMAHTGISLFEGQKCPWLQVDLGEEKTVREIVLALPDETARWRRLFFTENQLATATNAVPFTAAWPTSQELGATVTDDGFRVSVSTTARVGSASTCTDNAAKGACVGSSAGDVCPAAGATLQVCELVKYDGGAFFQRNDLRWAEADGHVLVEVSCSGGAVGRYVVIDLPGVAADDTNVLRSLGVKRVQSSTQRLYLDYAVEVATVPAAVQSSASTDPLAHAGFYYNTATHTTLPAVVSKSELTATLRTFLGGSSAVEVTQLPLTIADTLTTTTTVPCAAPTCTDCDEDNHILLIGIAIVVVLSLSAALVVYRFYTRPSAGTGYEQETKLLNWKGGEQKGMRAPTWS